jgi:hypothetical protein
LPGLAFSDDGCCLAIGIGGLGGLKQLKRKGIVAINAVAHWMPCRLY